MKKITKVLLITVLTVALICAVTVLSGAETETKPEIVSKNIAYYGNFSIMYAVDAETVEEGPVTLNLYAGDPASGAEIKRQYVDSDTEVITSNDKEYTAYVFETEGVAAKDMADVFYVQAVDAKGNESDVVAYSVVEYMLERLYGGYELSVEQEELYRYSLMFGEKAQKLLAKGETLVTDYRYVTYGDNAYILEKDTAISLQLPEGYNGWKLTDLDTGSETLLSADAALSVIGNISVEPYLQEGDGEDKYAPLTFTNTTASALRDAGMLLDGGYQDVIHFDEDASTVTQGDYLIVAKKDGEEALLYGSTYAWESRLLFSNFADNVTTTEDDNYILEFDVNFESATKAGYSGTRYYEIGFFAKDSSYTDESAVVLLSTDPTIPDEKFFSFGGITDVYSMVENEWYKIRIEIAGFRSEQPEVSYYVDGNLIGSYTLSGSREYDLDFAYFQSSWGEDNGKVWIDNFYFANVDDTDLAE